MFKIGFRVVPTLAMTIALAANSPGEGRAMTPKQTPQDTLLSSGEFNRIDRSHWARGRAAIYQTAEGTFVLEFLDDFASARGPDLRVVLSPHRNPRRGRDLGEYVELDHLRESSGVQSYIIPDGVDVSATNSVVIYCKRFNVIFSVAQLSPDAG